jgi:SlyX protein
MSIDERISSLEISAAHQQQVIDDLNAVVIAQAGELASLRRRLDALTKRFLVVEEQIAPDVPIDKPPHW